MLGSSKILAALLFASPFFAFDQWHEPHHFVDCDRGGTINGELGSLRPGDTLSVVGTCNENVAFSSPVGQFNGVTLDGNGTAAIVGPVATENALELDGVANFTVTGIRISGGFDGLSVNTGNQIAIENVTVANAGRHGIHLQRATTMAFVINSTIKNNPQNGIIVNENSYARIGFTSQVRATEDDPGPCVIQGNGGYGIRVQRSSQARIYNNTISDNARNGVNIESASYAEIATNTIDGNLGNGIALTENSTLHLGNPTGSTSEDNPNITNVPNAGFGLQAQWGSFVSGRLGTLTGTSGPSSFTHGANDDLTP